MNSLSHLVLVLVLALVQVGTVPAAQVEKDIHSYANPEHVRVRQVDLDLQVDFERKSLAGHATLTVERTSDDPKQPLLLDSRGLRIKKVEWSTDGRSFAEGSFSVGAKDPILGEKLSIPAPADVKRVRIHYSTGPRASALQWLDREQTGGKRHPFLFTQSQAIHARSWIPLQDSPGVRITYTARIRTPRGLLAVMSANNDPKKE